MDTLTPHNGAVNLCAAVWECGDDPGHCVSLNSNRKACFPFERWWEYSFKSSNQYNLGLNSALLIII